MRNLVEDGKTMTYPAPAPVASGELVVLDDMVGVAVSGGATGDAVTLAVEGVYRLPKGAGTIQQGQRVYADTSGESPAVTSSKEITPEEGTIVELVSAGVAWETSDGDTVAVKINA